jgi:tetrapyrrole methylase family protein/MazG family protein
MAEPGREFEKLLELVARLRSEDGCPWDREQTPTTIKRYLLEEVYELVDAVEHRHADQVADELGDLIFMTIFLAHLYVEQDQFQMEQVLSRVAEKMIRRHPHVFGNRQVDSAGQVKLNWEEIKRQEKPHKPVSAVLDAVPRALPSLLRSYRILSRLARNLQRPLNQDILLSQLRQAFSSLFEQGVSENGSPLEAILGNLFLLVVAFGLPENIRAEEALASALERFCAQVKRVEAGLNARGKDWQDLSEAEELSLWENL